MQIEITRQAEKFIRKIERGSGIEYERVMKAIETLPDAIKNRTGDIKPLVGYPGQYRMRVGDCRIFFTANRQTQTISILGISFRGDAY